MTPLYDTIVVGAGISGLTIAGELSKRGRSVLILEKSRGLGGRLATRRSGDELSPGLADTGAQYAPIRNREWAARLARNPELETLPSDTTGEVRGVLHPLGMSRLARTLLHSEAPPPRIELQTRAVHLHAPKFPGEEWGIEATTGTQGETQVFRAREVVLALPIPQSLDLLDATLPEGPRKDAPWEGLRILRYTRCLAVVATLPEDLQLSAPPIREFTDPNENARLTGIYLQREKGLRSARRTVVVHASPTRSLELWDEDSGQAATKIWASAHEFLFPAPVESTNSVEPLVLHRWKFARPETLSRESCAVYRVENGSIGVCGDAFGAGGIEGAFASALALDEKMGGV